MLYESVSLILTDISLTLSNLTSALDSLPDILWDTLRMAFGFWMDVPLSIRNKIQSQLSSDKERKAEVLRVISTEHPHLTWEHVSDALYQLEDGEYHHVLEKVQSRFPTGEHLSYLLFLHLPSFALYLLSTHVCSIHYAETKFKWARSNQIAAKTCKPSHKYSYISKEQDV